MKRGIFSTVFDIQLVTNLHPQQLRLDYDASHEAEPHGQKDISEELHSKGESKKKNKIGNSSKGKSPKTLF